MSNHSIWDNKFYIWELELTVLSSGKCFRRGWFPCSCVFFFSSIPELVKNEHISAAGYQSLSLVPFSTGEVTFWCSLHDFLPVNYWIKSNYSWLDSLPVGVVAVTLPLTLSTGGTWFPALYETFLRHRSSCSSFVLYLSDRNILGSLCFCPSTPPPLPFFSVTSSHGNVSFQIKLQT